MSVLETARELTRLPWVSVWLVPSPLVLFLATPRVAAHEPQKVHRIGILERIPTATNAANLGGFRQGRGPNKINGLVQGRPRAELSRRSDVLAWLFW